MISALLAGILLPTAVFCSPIFEARAFTPPATTLPNGAVNPFYPCGTDPATCPYRCYVLPPASTNSTQNNLAQLVSTCFSQEQAADFVDLSKHPKSAGHACVKCVTPNAVEVPKNKNSPLNCQPVETYFHSTASQGSLALAEFPNYPLSPPYPRAALPSRCGSRANFISACAWECGEAQVPFSVCAPKNNTGEFEQCSKCVPQCSSPVTVGGNGAPARGPDLSNVGACAKGVASVECPWSCQAAGRESENDKTSYRFCSVVDKSDSQNGGFVSCTKCPAS